jgi:hypothetical protein
MPTPTTALEPIKVKLAFMTLLAGKSAIINLGLARDHNSLSSPTKSHSPLQLSLTHITPHRGSKVRISKKHDAGIQEQSRLHNQQLHTKVVRSEARTGTKHIGKVSRKHIDSELAEIKKEQQEEEEEDGEPAEETQDHMASRDEQEWQSMNAMQRLALEGENALYGWLLTGYEPL